MNKLFLIGNLTRDPELSETKSGTSVCKFSIAVNRRYKNADNETVTDFFNITAWRECAENCGKYLSKGKKVAVIGELQLRNYDDKEGVKRLAVDIIAENVEFLSPASHGDEGKPDEPPKQTRKTQKQQSMLEPCDDDLPF